MEHAAIREEENFMIMKGGKAYTIADIEALPEDQHAELIDGELFMMATPSSTHQEILVHLLFEIEGYIRKNKGECKVYPAPYGVYIKDDDRHFVEPDISVICDKEKIDEKGCHGAPDWVIEIVSPASGQMEYVRKLALYQTVGVREYWIVDPQRETITVYDLKHGGKAEEYSFSERIKVGIYEDLYLNLAE